MGHKFRDQSGFSLVEVIVAMGLSVTIFFFLNSSMVKMQKAQKKFEKRFERERVKNFLRTALTDIRAWEENPKRYVPAPDSDSNFYYKKFGNDKPIEMTWTEGEFKKLDPTFSCKSKGCRVAVFKFSGIIVKPGETTELPSNYFLAVIGFLTNSELISRSYLPELMISLSDTSKDGELRVLSQNFFINTLQRKAHQKLTSNSGVIDPVSRAKCFTLFLKNFPGMVATGNDLCSKAENITPAECYIKMKKQYQVKDIVALVTCSRATNPFPIECFKKGKGELGADEAHLAILCSGAKSLTPINCVQKIRTKVSKSNSKNLEYKVCARAMDKSPADCFLEIYKSESKYIAQSLSLCPHHK